MIWENRRIYENPYIPISNKSNIIYWHGSIKKQGLWTLRIGSDDPIEIVI